MSKGINRIIQEDREKEFFKVKAFHHLEWFVNDAQSVTQMFKIGFGMKIVAVSKHETGNHSYASYVLQSANVKWVVTAPYLSEFEHPDNNAPLKNFDKDSFSGLVRNHGNGVGAIGILVDDAAAAHRISTAHGAPSMLFV